MLGMQRTLWNKEKCAIEALKYNTKTEFNKACVGAYTHARKHGFLDEICSHMEIKWQRKWDSKEKCHAEALKYESRGEFQEKCDGAYTYALRHGFLDEICTHMTAKWVHVWNKETCKVEALKYNRRIDFQRGNDSAYTYAMRHGFLDEICTHMTSYGNLNPEKEKKRHEFVRTNLQISDEEWEELKILLDNPNQKIKDNRKSRKRCIYVCEFSDNHVYVGLTQDLRRRIKQHLREPDSAIFLHIQETNIAPTFKIVRHFAPEKTAQKNEREVEKEYKNAGWILLNRAKTGALGSDYLYWTLERCKGVARHCSNFSDFIKRFSGAYASCVKNEWLEIIREILPYKTSTSHKWTNDRLIIEAKKYETRMEFRRSSPSAYSAALKRGILQEVCSHMKRPCPIPKKQTRPNQKYSYNLLCCTALKYKTRSEFRKFDYKMYDAANKRNLLDDICSHMPEDTVSRIKWTKEACSIVAKQYNTRMEFKRGDGSAYTTSVREGWLDEICSHMTKPKVILKWTPERLQEIAKKYTKRKDFKKNEYSAYVTAVRLKIIDEICSHMEAKKTHKKTTPQK